LLMACRSFDLKKDNRLRELITKDTGAINIITKKFSIEIVKSILQKLGFLPSTFSQSQINLLQHPFHLSLFAQVAEKNRDKEVAFTTAINLFDAYWEKKRCAVEKIVRPQNERWLAVIDRLCEEMNEQQTLSIEESIVLDDYEETVRALETEHIIISDGRKIGFFHDNFFDYTFARRFATKRQDLIEYLKLGEQHLFKRSLMRQILMHEYASASRRFITDLSRILTDSEIRFHLKKAALEASEKIDYAGPELWELFSGILTGEDPALSREVWWVLINSKAWFPFLFDKKLLRDWLASPDDVIRRRALKIILSQVQSYPEESVKLLEPYVCKSQEWNREILQIIRRNAMHESRAVFDLFLRMVENDAVDEEDRFGFWTCIDDMPRRNPAWTAEAVGIYLRRVLDRIDINEIKKHFLGRDRSGVQLLPIIAKAVPVKFLEHVLPFFLEIVSKTSQEKEGRLISDPVWSIRMCWPDSYNLENALLIGLETALKALAKNSPEEFSRYMEILCEYGDYDSVNFLLVRAFSVSDPEFADQIIDYIIGNPQRLECGWSGGASGDYRYWATRELIEHVGQHCSDESFNKIEKTILNHYPQFELSKDGLKARGYWQLILLTALDPGRRNILVKDRLRELWRKFPDKEIIPPQASRGGVVHTPIPEKAAEKMTDEQWLGAIRKYNTEESDWSSSVDFLKGSAIELSRVLEEETQQNPERFAQLGLQLPAEAHRYYFGAILRGLNKSNIEKEKVFEVVREFFTLPNKPGIRWIPDLIKKYSKENIPEDILAIVGWLATEAEDPKNDELTSYRVNEPDENYPNDIFGNAINSIRGTAAEAAGQLIADDANRIPVFIPHIERMVEDPTVVVRTTVACTLRGLCIHDEELAVTLFIKLSETDNTAFFATPHVDQFIYYAASRHFDRLYPILRRMLDSTLAVVREAGARHACIAYFRNSSAKELVAECLTGDESKRKGAVRIAAANVGYKKCQEFSHSALIQFFDDPVKEIRDLAANCFGKAEERQLESCRDLIRSFLRSKAFEGNIDELMRALKYSTADIAEETLDACEAAIAVLENQGAGLGSRIYFEGGEVAELVLRAYSQSDDGGVQSRCLDLIDWLLSIEAYGIKNELDSFQR